MNHLKTLLLLLCLFTTAGCYSQDKKGGVPISYDLTFDIPADSARPVTGHEVLKFFLDRKQDVWLNFMGQLVTPQCRLNNKNVTAQQDQWLIKIPKKRTRVGENVLELDFAVSDAPFMRSDYYLFVPSMENRAQLLFPTMGGLDEDKPIKINLTLPEGWNGVTSESEQPISPNSVTFMAGHFQKKSMMRGERQFTLMYRPEMQVDDAKLSALIDDAEKSIKWMEQYTGIAYPLDLCNIVVLPDYEPRRPIHPGALLLNEKTTFPQNAPTDIDATKRLEIVAHETAHIWLGTLVQAEDSQLDLAYELLANYLATEISWPQLQKSERDLTFMRSNLWHANHVGMTGRAHSIEAELDKLDHVGLKYGDIVSTRATVMMEKLTEMMDAEKLHKGLQQFLADHAFGKATWAQCAETLNKQGLGLDITTAFQAWTQSNSIPIIETSYSGGNLIIRQQGGNGWDQTIDVRLGYDMEPSKTITVQLHNGQATVPVASRPNFIIPNYSGVGFGRFRLTRDEVMTLTERPIITRNAQNRYALLLTLYDNYLMGVSSPYYFGELVRTLEAEKEPNIIATLCDHLKRLLNDKSVADRDRMEKSLMGVMQFSSSRDCHSQVARMLSANATCKEVINYLYDTWKNQSDRMLNERDYMELSYRLALLRPAEWQNIVNTQLSRLTDPALQREYSFVSRACASDPAAQQQLFQDLLKHENRRNEPWAEAALRLLNSVEREPQNNALLRPALEALEDIRLTNSAAFPRRWLYALLSDHRSHEARQQVEKFLDDYPDYPILLRNKILEAASELLTTR